MDHQKPIEKSSDYLYLERLSFRPELRKMWLNFFVTNFRVVILLIMLVSAWGIYSYFQLPRESNPEVKIPIAVVTTVFPGAAPSDVEELVTKKIETGASGIPGVKKITSSSVNSFSAVTVEFDADQDLDDSIRKLRDKVSDIQRDLPDDAGDAAVVEISFDNTPILTLVLSGPYDGLTLRSYADKIKEELEKKPGVREVSVSGGDTREFEVAYDPQKLDYYKISPQEANQAIAATNSAIPSGNFEGQKYNYPIRTDGRFFKDDELRKVPIRHSENGAMVYLRDIAEVREKTVERTVFSRLSIKGSAPQESVTINVVKKTGGSVINIVDDAKKTVAELVKTFPAGITYDFTLDFAKVIKHDFDQLSHDFLITLLLVFGILFLIVGFKEALVAGLAIPLVFFATFGVMLATGLTLNFLSIFSLLLSLGLLVDDAIVVVSATKQYLRTGKFTPEEAVLLVLNDFKVVLTTTTLTTVWAFLPLLLSTGIMGEFIKSIPITVSVTLIASLFIALMINHPLAAVLERIRLTKKLFLGYMFVLFGLAGILLGKGGLPGYILGAVFLLSGALMEWWYRKGGRGVLEKNKAQMEAEWKDEALIKEKLRTQGSHQDAGFLSRLIHGIIHFDRLIPIYEHYLRKVIRTPKRRAVTIATVVVLFVGSMLLPALGIVPLEFFPASDEETIFVNIEAPVGLKLSETNAIVSEAEQVLLGYPEIANFSTIVGKEGLSPNQASNFLKDASHLASIVVTLTDKESRQAASYELSEKMQIDLQKIGGAKITAESLKGGPPAGAAFEARILGDDLNTLDRIAHELEPQLAAIPGVNNTSISLKEAPAEYTFTLNREQLELLNLNAASVGGMLRMAISGVEVSTVLRDNKELKIMARFADGSLPDLASVGNLKLLNFRNQPVFLKDVAKIELKPSVDSVVRIDQKRAVLLSAGVSGSTRPNEVLTQFQERLKNDYKLPAGYSVVYGGENEQNTESVVSILKAMVIAILLIVSTLIIQFNSFKKALIVLVTLPLALIGVFVGMAIFGVNLSFPGLIGILALFGIVVKNAIILIDKINLNLKSGIVFDDAIIDAGKSRLEAIFITSICTICGIIPVTLSNALWTALGSAVIFGLSVSSFLTLFIVPVLFRTLIGEKERV